MTFYPGDTVLILQGPRSSSLYWGYVGRIAFMINPQEAAIEILAPQEMSDRTTQVNVESLVSLHQAEQIVRQHREDVSEQAKLAKWSRAQRGDYS